MCSFFQPLICKVLPRMGKGLKIIKKSNFNYIIYTLKKKSKAVPINLFLKMDSLSEPKKPQGSNVNWLYLSYKRGEMELSRLIGALRFAFDGHASLSPSYFLPSYK